MVLESDEEANKKQRVDRVRQLILRDPQQLLPAPCFGLHLALDVKGIRFFVNVCVDEDQGWTEEKCLSENLRLRTELPENSLATGETHLPEDFSKNLGDQQADFRNPYNCLIGDTVAAGIGDAAKGLDKANTNFGKEWCH